MKPAGLLHAQGAGNVFAERQGSVLPLKKSWKRKWGFFSIMLEVAVCSSLQSIGLGVGARCGSWLAHFPSASQFIALGIFLRLSVAYLRLQVQGLARDACSPVLRCTPRSQLGLVGTLEIQMTIRDMSHSPSLIPIEHFPL